MDVSTWVTVSRSESLTEDRDENENTQPKFGGEWERFEDKFVTRRTKKNFDQFTSDAETETADVSPRFGDAWEKFEEVTEKTNAQKEEPPKIVPLKAEDEMNLKRISAFEDFAKLRLRAVSLQGIYNINRKEEKFVCEISDICQLSDETLVITDIRNKSLKKLGVNYDVDAYLKLPDHPFGVCKVDKKQVAITLVSQRKVQFVSVKKKLALTKSFHVKECCRGILYCNELFYICCGGSSSIDTVQLEGQGHIEVYNISGTFLSTYGKGISTPRYLYITHDLTRIFVTDQDNGIVVLDLDGRLVSQINIDGCSYPSGICCLSNEQLCVAYHERNEILALDETGSLKQTLLQRKEGLLAPRAVCYDVQRSRLVVSSMLGDDTIKVFNLHLM